jgi:sigma-B regulation protein RsbU (phosphoserine phosphatase)
MIPPARILVVDDEPDLEPLILQKFRRKIRDGELEFVFARHGEDALDQLHKDPSIGIVLSDINMPVMDGLTLLTHIAALDRQLKTVIVSAYDDMQNIRTAMNRGAFDFLTKPIDFHDFEATLRKTRDELESIRQAILHRDQLFALQNELSIAGRIQQSILPRDFPVSPHFELCARMLPARVVSGDFYDFFLLDDRRLGFAVGDVSGKGIPAAIYMAVSRTLLRATVAQKLTPVECLMYVNHVLVRQGEGDMFVTMFYGVLDLTTGELEYCVAGHTPPWLISATNGVQPLKQIRGTMLGLFEDPEIGNDRIALTSGDTLLVATDGVMDAERKEGGEFSEQGIRTLLESSAAMTAAQTVDHVFSAISTFSEGANQFDDITAMAVRFTGPAN